jgi:hypothetical protein
LRYSINKLAGRTLKVGEESSVLYRVRNKGSLEQAFESYFINCCREKTVRILLCGKELSAHEMTLYGWRLSRLLPSIIVRFKVITRSVATELI